MKIVLNLQAVWKQHGIGAQKLWIVVLALMVSDGTDSKNPLTFLGLCD